MANHKAVMLGATSALAQAVARRLVATGSCDYFYLVGRDAIKLKAVADDLVARGVEVRTIVLDLDDIEEHGNLVSEVGDASSWWFFYGSLPDQEKAEQNWQECEAALKTNFLSSASLLTRIANLLEPQQRSSSIVVVSSVAGDRGRKSNYVYGTAKGALSLFTQGLRNRLASSSVHLMTVKPGFIDTPMTAGIEKKPAVLWATPEKIASLVVDGFEKKKDVLYTPWFWRYILLVIKLVPEFVFKKLSL